MSTLGFIEYDKPSPDLRAVYDDIMSTRKTDKINNFWKTLAHDPARLKRTWEDTKTIMAAGQLDPLVRRPHDKIFLRKLLLHPQSHCAAL